MRTMRHNEEKGNLKKKNTGQSDKKKKDLTYTVAH